MIEEILKYIRELVSNGKLELAGTFAETSLAIQAKILEIVDGTEYYGAVQKYAGTIDTIERVIVSQYASINDLDVKDVVFGNKFRSQVVNVLEDALLQDGFLSEIIEPIRDVIAKQALYGVSFEEAEKEVSDYITKNGLGSQMKSVRPKQVGRDLLYQYDGAIQREIQKDYGMNAFIYVGGHVKDTRPFCDHLADREDGEWFIDELEEVLEEYCPNGVPSGAKVSYTTIGGVKESTKGAGMIRGTSVDNFAILRGGYNCLHEVIYIFKEKR